MKNLCFMVYSNALYPEKSSFDRFLEMFDKFCQMIGTAVLFVIGSLWFDWMFQFMFYLIHHHNLISPHAFVRQKFFLGIFRGTTIMVQKIISQYGLKVEGQLRLLKNFELSITSSSFWIFIRLHPLRHLYTTFPLHLLLLHQSRNNLRQFSLGIKGGLEFKSSSKSR